MNKLSTLFAFWLAMGLGLATGIIAANAAPPTEAVNCSAPGRTIQSAVDSATSGGTIFIFGGTCVGDVTIKTDDITLSGNKMGNACDKANPSASAAGTIDGEVTIDGVRAKIEFLEITGSGQGIFVTNRADAQILCSHIHDNDASGVAVNHDSNAVLRDNLVENNGQEDLAPTLDPTRNFHCGLYVLDASSVHSFGNTYRGNAYCAIASQRESVFQDGTFSPRRAGNPIDGTETDSIIQRGCASLDVSGCDAGLNDFDAVAVEVFNGGSVYLRNSEVTGKIEVSAGSHFRVDDHGKLVGTIDAQHLSLVRLRNRNIPDDGRVVSFEGLLEHYLN